MAAVEQLERIEYTERGKYGPDGKLRVFRCPDWSAFAEPARLVTCKRRGCPRCGKPWLWDVVRSTAGNLEHFAHRLAAAEVRADLVMVSITAPGADQLPWDEEHCKHRRPHEHTGPGGCRVQQRAAREWSDTLTWRWSKLRAAAILATRRQLRGPDGELGPAPAIITRFYEPQKRGVPHLHPVLAYGTEAERDAAHIFVGHLKRLAPQYAFGFADGRGKRKGVRHQRPVVERHGVELRPLTGADVARYLATYLTGRNSKKKGSIRDNLADPNMPRSLFWISPALTSVSSAERIQTMRERLLLRCGTGLTMRWLRMARRLWAVRQGYADEPRWESTEEAIVALTIYLQVYEKRPPPDDLTPALKLARQSDRRAKAAKTWISYRKQIGEFAGQLVRASMPDVLEAAA